MIVSEDLIRRIERSEAGRVASSAKAFGGDVVQVAGGVASFCGEGNVMTQCVGVGSDGEPSKADIERIAAHYRGRCSVFEFKLSTVSAHRLRKWVVRRAKSLPEFETLLVRSLSDFVPSEVALELREVTPEDALAYAERSASRFFTGDAPPGLVEVIAASCVGPDVRSYEAYVDGKPAAGCSLGFADGIAWLGGAAVDPEYRGRGIHRQMQAYRLATAKEMGFELACQGALAGSLSQQNAQRIGFDIAFTRPTFLIEPA